MQKMFWQNLIVVMSMGLASLPALCDDTAGENSSSNPGTDTINAGQADNGQAAHTSPPQTTTTVTPRDKTYDEALLNISKQIDQKIAEVQAKQQELNSEIYPASKPPLQAELNDLQNQLKDLEMQRDQIQTQKTSEQLQQQLNKANQPPAAP